MKKIFVAWLSLVIASVACADAAFTVDNIFGDRMVVQRDKPVRVSGSAEPALLVKATFRGETREATAGADGRWALEFSAGKAGGPFEMAVAPGWEKAGEPFVFRDILVGEVWVCSGQSNMSYPVWAGDNPFFRLPGGDKIADAANDGRLRLFNGRRSLAVDGPRTDMTGRPSWQAATSREAVGPFSAIGYFFGSKLRKALEDDIPVGMINVSWGGTMIEPWIPESEFARCGREDVVSALAAARFSAGTDPVKALSDLRLESERRFKSWLDAFFASDPEATKAAMSRWALPGLDVSDWKKCSYGMLDGLAVPGVCWYRFDFKVPESWAEDELVFHMDFVNDADETFVDGTKIGATGPFSGVKEYWCAPRDYRFRAAAGRHVAAVRAADHYGTGGIGEQVWVANVRSGEKIALPDGDWTEKVEFRADISKIGVRPNPFGAVANPRTNRDTPSALYNAMVNPVSQMNVGGVIWYQGCSNSGNPDGYAALEKMLFDSWRAAFRDPMMPFVATQLSSLYKHTPSERLPDDFWKGASPDQLGFAPLRAAQEKMASYPNTSLVCTIDLGDHSDIHPCRKEEVANRLLGEALRLKYGRKESLPGPRFKSMTRRGDTMAVSFRDIGKGIAARNGAIHPRMFAVAGEDGKFVWAEAKLAEDGTVHVRAEGVARPVRVRYAYWSCPIFDGLYRVNDGLPVFPFEASLCEEVTVSAPAGTHELQAAIDRVAAAGGGTVHVARGDYPVACLMFRDNVTIDLAEGARLYGETNELLRIARGVEDESNLRAALIVGKDVSNIALVGRGRVDGCGQAATPYVNNRSGRWKLIALANAKNFRMEGVTLENSASWTCYFHRCDGIVVRGVRLDGHANYNNDGFDIEAKNVLIEDCDIDCEDDAICGKIHDPSFVSENVEVRNCRLASNCNFVKTGTASKGIFRNWYVHDCVMERCRAAPFDDLQWMKRKIPGVDEPISGLAGIALEAVDGGAVENVLVDRVEMKSGVQTPFFLRVGARKGDDSRPFHLRNVAIQNVKASSCSWIASSITGVPGRRLGGNVLLRNIDLTTKGGIDGESWKKPVPESEKEYPENRCFGTPLPAHGFYLRHADGVRFENVTIRVDGDDSRPAVIKDDCMEVVFGARREVVSTATGVRLVRDGTTVWNFEIDTPEGRPFFHPLTLPSGRRLTDARPADHVWHLGYWFSWKFINGVNYWEPADADRRGHEPAGETKVVKKSVRVEDLGCTVDLDLCYGPRGKSPVLSEKRTVVVDPPDAQGAYAITTRHHFTALEDVVLDRSEPWGSVASGKWGAGYAGMTLRLDPQAAAAFAVSGSAGGHTPGECTAKETTSLSFTDPASGEGVTFAQLKAPPSARFYLWPDKRMINPSVVYTGPMTLKKGETLDLAYRLAVRSGPGALVAAAD